MTKSKIKELRDKGMTYREIGEKLGVSKQRIHQIFMGVKTINIYVKKGRRGGTPTPLNYIRWYLRKIGMDILEIGPMEITENQVIIGFKKK